MTDPVEHAVHVAAACSRIFDAARIPIAIAVSHPQVITFYVADTNNAHMIRVQDAEWIARRVAEINEHGIIARTRPGWV